MVAEQIPIPKDNMAMSDEQVRMLLDGLLTGLGKKGGGDNEGNVKRVLEDKIFSRMTKYGGVEKDWKEWDFNLQLILHGVSSNIKRIFEVMEGTTLGENWDETMKGKIGAIAGVSAEAAMNLYLRLATEVFGQLCQLTEGEPNRLVRGAEGKNGFRAWMRLSERYNAKSPQSMLRKLQHLVKPPDVKQVKGMCKAIENWELGVRDWQTEYQVDFPEAFKLAISIGMCPQDLQDDLYKDNDIAGGKVKYTDIKEKIVRISMNRIAQDTPTPMDIGQVTSQEQMMAGAQWADEINWCGICGEDELEIDYIGGDSRCHQCGGKGHFARECPSGGKGKGKGEYKGKGNFKGKGKGDTGGYTGKGYQPYKGGKGYKGYKGEGKGKGEGRTKGGALVCFTCGKLGHKSDSCWTSVAEVGVDAEDEGIDIGGVWAMAVEVEDDEEEEKMIAAVEVEKEVVGKTGEVKKEVERKKKGNNLSRLGKDLSRTRKGYRKKFRCACVAKQRSYGGSGTPKVQSKEEVREKKKVMKEAKKRWKKEMKRKLKMKIRKAEKETIKKAEL